MEHILPDQDLLKTLVFVVGERRPHFKSGLKRLGFKIVGLIIIIIIIINIILGWGLKG